ncbi:hypothetical protein PFDG_05371 [Plasmodium falciparum Dd2]|uniref:Uncharacterized protein n=1 Tax=Plasmodium falciparum (isolate Dd2) TaxID=57267 RepID=A0A0L7MAE4_PLAF4|nr:hypothetical protein PFDG_05371 [Plasmodium falciparum Dd2]
MRRNQLPNTKSYQKNDRSFTLAARNAQKGSVDDLEAWKLNEGSLGLETQGAPSRNDNIANDGPNMTERII